MSDLLKRRMSDSAKMAKKPIRYEHSLLEVKVGELFLE